MCVLLRRVGVYNMGRKIVCRVEMDYLGKRQFGRVVPARALGEGFVLAGGGGS